MTLITNILYPGFVQPLFPIFPISADTTTNIRAAVELWLIL